MEQLPKELENLIEEYLKCECCENIEVYKCSNCKDFMCVDCYYVGPCQICEKSWCSEECYNGGLWENDEGVICCKKCL